MLTDLLSFDFFRNALIAILLIGVASAKIGTYKISRRLVSIAGGVTHACFGGLGLGYFLGISPILMAGVTAIASAGAVEWMSASGKIREDSAIGVIWSVGMAVGVLFVFLTPGYVPELNSFLFGNILTIGTADLLAFAIYDALLILFFIFCYRTIIACAFDRDFARVSGMPERLVNYTMTAFIAIAIVLTIRLVGVMLLMSMFTLPQMSAELWSRSVGGIMMRAVCISILSGILALGLGAYVDVPLSALIVLVLSCVYILCKLITLVGRQK